MTWRTEKTNTGQDLVWSNPELGIAPSALKGTANLQNLNISTESGQAYVSFARTNQAQLAITGGTLTPDGATLFDAPTALKGGQWIKVTASTVTSISTYNLPSSVSADYLIVGGGGASGGIFGSTGGAGSGGGGAGEVVEDSATFAVGSYAVTVGDGGQGASGGGVPGNDGESSSIATVDTAIGGGGGGGNNTKNGNTGASGGGGGADIDDGSGVGGTGGTGTAGFDGGDGYASATNAGGGGGGGASAAANDVSVSAGADPTAGGDGVSSSVSGTATFYGGGGAGGGTNSSALGGSGGGGDSGQNGEANTGGGGGGVTGTTVVAATNGGSGIVIISYTTGTMIASGGNVTKVGTKTIHTFLESGTFQVLYIVPTAGLYFVSYKDGDDKIKLSTTFDPYGASPVTHGTTGSITFDVVATMDRPVAKATEKYFTTTSTEYRYYILDDSGYVWVYDTDVYSTTLADNNVGITWMLTDPSDYTNLPFRGFGVLNGWLILIGQERIWVKPTVLLGEIVQHMYNGYVTNPFSNNSKTTLSTSQGTLIYTDGNFIGEIFPTTSLISSVANVQSYASYTATTTTGTLATLYGGSTPNVTGSTRMPVVLFTGGTLPTAISADTVYYLDYNFDAGTFNIYSALTGGSPLDIATGSSGTQYFNTFYPIGSDAGAGGDNPTLQFSSQRVNLPFYEQAKSLVEIGNTVLIGCTGNIVYPWNQVDAVPSDVITLPESDVQTMINVNNTAYLFAGNKGNIYITNGIAASLNLKVPDYCAGVPGTNISYIEPYFTWGDADFVRGRVYFSILDQTASKAGNCGGVWSFVPSQNVDPNQDVGSALRLENQNSYGDYDGYAPIIIGAEEQNAISPQYWAAWQDSYDDATAGFGIDFTAGTPVTSARIETDLIPTGTMLDQKTFTQLEYKLGVPLNSGDSVQLYWRLNATSAWTSAGTVISETTNPLSGYFKVNFQKTQWTQIAAVIATGGTTASSFVPITEIRIR